MSPRAACRLEALGFDEVYDYVPGKVDWLSRGLPREGAKATERRAGDAILHEVVTARLEDRVGDVRADVEASPYGFALVLSEGGVLLGRLRRAAFEGDLDQAASAVMEAGPSTVRADTPIDELRARLEARDLRTAVVTTPDGVLVGVVRRQDL